MSPVGGGGVARAQEEDDDDDGRASLREVTGDGAEAAARNVGGGEGRGRGDGGGGGGGAAVEAAAVDAAAGAAEAGVRSGVASEVGVARRVPLLRTGAVFPDADSRSPQHARREPRPTPALPAAPAHHVADEAARVAVGRRDVDAEVARDVQRVGHGDQPAAAVAAGGVCRDGGGDGGDGEAPAAGAAAAQEQPQCAVAGVRGPAPAPAVPRRRRRRVATGGGVGGVATPTPDPVPARPRGRNLREHQPTRSAGAATESGGRRRRRLGGGAPGGRRGKRQRQLGEHRLAARGAGGATCGARVEGGDGAAASGIGRYRKRPAGGAPQRAVDDGDDDDDDDDENSAANPAANDGRSVGEEIRRDGNLLIVFSLVELTLATIRVCGKRVFVVLLADRFLLVRFLDDPRDLFDHLRPNGSSGFITVSVS